MSEYIYFERHPTPVVKKGKITHGIDFGKTYVEIGVWKCIDKRVKDVHMDFKYNSGDELIWTVNVVMNNGDKKTFIHNWDNWDEIEKQLTDTL